MLSKSYWVKMGILGGVLLVLAGTLAYAIYMQGPRVRLVRFSRDPQVVRYTYGSTIQLVFDRTLKKEEYTSQIHIEPSVAFSTRTQGKAIYITLQQSLKHNTRYTITAKPGIRDIRNRSMRQSYSHTIQTQQARFAFIKRNYDVNHINDMYSRKDSDQLKLATVRNEEVEVLFEAPVIRTYAINRDYAVVAVKETIGDTLHKVDLKTKKSTVLLKEDQWEVTSVAMSVDGSHALFIVYATEEKDTPPVLYLADLKADTIAPVKRKSGPVYDVWGIQQSTNNQIALAFDSKGVFVGLSPFGDFEPMAIGRYDSVYGFDDSTSTILLEKNGKLMRYSVETGRTTDAVLVDKNAAVRAADMRAGVTYVTTMRYKDGYAIPKIHAYYPDGTNKKVWQGDTEIRGAKVNYDGTLFAVEHRPSNCEQDSIGSWSVCKEMVTAVYNEKGETVDQVDGFHPIWIP